MIGVDRADFGENFPQNGLFIQSDISRPEDMQAIFEKAHAFTESLDALVNNAALQVAKPLVETTVEEWDAVMASNLRSVFLGVKLAYPLLKAGSRRGGGECLFCPCDTDVGEYRRVCRFQRRIAGSDACHGN